MELRTYPNAQNTFSFNPFSKESHYFFNFTRVNGTWGDEWKFWTVRTGENAWLALAVSRYISQSKTTDEKYLSLARTLGDAMILLQDHDTQGGIRFGPQEGASSYDVVAFNTINSENNVSAYAALQSLYKATGDAKYQKAAEKILTWLSDASIIAPDGTPQKGLMNPDTHTFYVGVEYREGQWHAQTKFATDSAGTWTISSLGPEKIDQLWGSGTAFKMWQTIRAKVGVTSDFKKSGLTLPIAGVDFTDGYL